jgi:hypothetical protein
MPLFIYSLLYSLLDRNGLKLRAIKGDDFRQLRCDARHFVGLSRRLVQAGTPVWLNPGKMLPAAQPAMTAPGA